MSRQDVHIVATGVANVASVRAAFERLGARPVETSEAATIATASRVVLPGVGSFGAAARRLEELALVDALRARVEAGLPTLGICLGMQLLTEGSEESPGVRGLGVVPGGATRFQGDLPVPQLGWNAVEPRAPGLIESGVGYFANTYRLTEAPAGWEVATTTYGGTFVSAMQRGAVLACQFHPELSGAWGARLLGRWLAAADPVQGGA